MEIVYLETSFISLLVANPSRDLVTAANQQSTRDWWRLRRGEFVCVASSEVVREASQGDPQEVRKRLETLRELTMLGLTPEAESLTREISRCYEGIIPQNNFEVWHVDKIPFMKARFAAAGYLKPGPSLPPYQYIAPDRLEIAKECGGRSRALQQKYSAAAESAPVRNAVA